MNSTIFYRLLWKEFRQVRGITASLLIAGLLIQFAAALFTRGEGGGLIEGVAYIFPILAITVIASIIFSIEHENRSFMMKRLLPVTCRQVISGKLFVTLASATLIAAVLWLVAACYGKTMFAEVLTPQSTVLITCELFAWGIFYSLVSRNALRGLVFSVATTMGTAFLCLYTAAFLWDVRIQSLQAELAWTWLRIGVLIAVCIADVWLARRWFADDLPSWKPGRSIESILPKARIRQSTKVSVGAIGSASRVVWLQLRLLGAVYVAVLIAAVSTVVWLLHDVHDEVEARWVTACVAALFASLTGGSSFSGMHKSRSLLNQHAIQPGKVWIASLSVASITLVIFAIFWLIRMSLLPTGELHGDAPYRVDMSRWQAFLTPVSFLLIGFAAGQYVSQFARNIVVACGVSLLAGICAYLWVLNARGFNIPASVYALPPVALLLVLSYVNTSAWLKGWSNLRVQVPAIVFGFIAAVACVLGWRAFEIPPSDPVQLAAIRAAGSERVNRDTAEYQEFVELGTRVRDRRKSHADKKSSEYYSPELVDEILDLEVDIVNESFHFSSALWQYRALNYRINIADELYGELFDQLQLALKQQDIEIGEKIIRWGLAREIHPAMSAQSYRWAELPNNSPERILNLIPAIDASASTKLRRSRNMESVGYVQYSRLLKSGPGDLHGVAEDEAAESKFWFQVLRFAFWEQYRSQRALDRDTIIRQRIFDSALKSLRDGVSFEQANQRAEEIADANRRQEAFLVYEIKDDNRGLAFERYYSEAFLNIQELMLGISAWKHDHDGMYPETLDELVPDYLSELPVDPFSPNGFYYFPEGIDLSEAAMKGVSASLQTELCLQFNSVGLQRSKPFLVSGVRLRNTPSLLKLQSEIETRDLLNTMPFPLEPSEPDATEQQE